MIGKNEYAEYPAELRFDSARRLNSKLDHSSVFDILRLGEFTMSVRKRPWANEDDAKLAALIAARAPPHQIAANMKRRAEDVRRRAAELSLRFSSYPSKATKRTELPNP